MQLIRKFKQGIRFFLFAIDIFCKFAWVVHLKGKKSITITNAFQKIVDESNCKPNKTSKDKGSKFYNRSVKSWLQDNDIEMYSTHNKGNSVLAERFIRTLKKNLQMFDFSIKNVYIDKLVGIFNK